MENIQDPCPSFPCYLDFLVFLPFQRCPSYFAPFSLLIQDFRGSVGMAHPCFLGWFSMQVSKKQGKDGQGISFPDWNFQAPNLRMKVSNEIEDKAPFCGELKRLGVRFSSKIENGEKGRNTVSRVLFRRRELAEPHWVLRQTRWVLRKTRWVRFGTQIIGRQELTEFAPRNLVRANRNFGRKIAVP